jgi:translation initiation factor 1
MITFFLKKTGKISMSDSRLVYSTETGRICPECGRPVSTGCTCGKKKRGKAGRRPSGFPEDGTVRIQREVKGRKGKTVTAVFGVPLENGDLRDFAKALKRRCGTGGSVKDGVIVIQGDHRQTLLDEIKKRGYTAKLAGG